jgi:hypothetical protein
MEAQNYLDRLTQCKDFDSVIIKGHLFTEYHLERYIESKSAEKIDIQDLRLSYAVKMEVSKILGLFVNDKTLYKNLKLLNKLRNSIAHNLHHDEKILIEFLEGFDELISRYGSSQSFKQ